MEKYEKLIQESKELTHFKDNDLRRMLEERKEVLAELEGR